jgi:hypothetical protein
MSKRRPWTAAEDDTIIRGVLAKKTDAQIADELKGRTESQVSVRLHAIRSKYPKLPNRKAGRTYPERQKSRQARHVIPAIPDSFLPVVRELMRTMTDQQIGEKIGYEADAVLKFRKAHKLMKPRGGYKNLCWPMPNAAGSGHQPELLEVYTDEQGRTIRRFAPGWAWNARPQRSVGSKE